MVSIPIAPGGRSLNLANAAAIAVAHNHPSGDPAPSSDDVAFTAELQRHNVLVVPGRGFGSPGHFRISYCVDDRTLEGSLQGFQTAIQRNRTH